jgi:hypothetical protein
MLDMRRRELITLLGAAAWPAGGLAALVVSLDVLFIRLL